jgi:sugar transferase (PEP-CTERM/EpsH1 system associated)
MRILFLTHRLPYAPNRGDRLRAWHQLRFLSRQHEITLVSLVHDRDEAGHAPDLAPITRETVVAPVPGLRNRLRGALALPTNRPLTHLLLDSPSVRPQLERIVAEWPPDVVLAYCSGMARFALEPPLARFPLVLDMVDADSAKWASLATTTRPPVGWVYCREARLLQRFEALAMRRAVATLVVNERERQALLTFAPEARVVVVPNGIDIERFRPSPRDAGATPGSPAVVFCGVMDYPPNEAGAVWLAHEVWPGIRQAQPAAQLWIVGARPTARVKALQAAHSGITVTGSVDDVRPFLWNAAVSAAPLHTARGIQNKVLEAVAAGLPAVVTQAVWDGLPAEVRPACRLGDTAVAFGAHLRELLSLSPSQRTEAAAGADLAALAWDHTLAPLSAILKEAAGGRGS